MVATHMSHREGVSVTPNLLTRRLNLIKDYLIEWLASIGAAFGRHSSLLISPTIGECVLLEAIKRDRIDVR